ncbi:flagellar biosynthesis protein FlgF [Tabrizicola sp. TH137]|uniref:flagellar hook-basal body complex protein n=1 Tax=Tabrizicola sp. TH137 TaxID=2067452 RepID=UPI000C7A6621|nr:flagellar hook-basal body complex protein [Tabrizicola sp. TH137]PLL14621.1 flagellar biosynthesis protein FlgF [Tabrizicola sp. TH137]
MESTGYVTLGRQSGLMREMQVLANNIANGGTAGFRREGVVFSEYVRRTSEGPSLSMARGEARHVDLREGALQQTGGRFDFAIRGEGFFLVETPDGPRLTRAGAFLPGPDGAIVTPEGHRLLDAGGAAIILPPGGEIALGADGTLSAGGQPVARIGLWQPQEATSLRHVAGTLFEAGDLQPVDAARLVQGSLEESNVRPVEEVARLIEVQRAYEFGQGFMDREDERLRNVIRTLGE